MKNVNILGTEYSIEIDDTLEKTELDGLCKEYDKRISIRNAGSMLDDDDSTGVKKIRFDEVLRHEIIHAFFYEAGLEDYSDNEQLVDWIAKQFPKLEKAFKEADCL
jgi:hypothetical protein|uniref:hypothetical protein n=1 Tax=Lachnospira eligens TaxID=39485 RepID=UPI0020580554|nr:MAG TPA: peptidase [Caudoviricetes sp.]